MGNIIRRLLESFYLKRMDIVLVGLENSGKTTLLGVLADGHPIDTVPTIGLDVRTLRRGRVQMKCWDLGGQEQYRSEWARYTSGCDVILFIVDSNAVSFPSPQLTPINSSTCYPPPGPNSISCLRTESLRRPQFLLLLIKSIWSHTSTKRSSFEVA